MSPPGVDCRLDFSGLLPHPAEFHACASCPRGALGGWVGGEERRGRQGYGESVTSFHSKGERLGGARVSGKPGAAHTCLCSFHLA